jgi:hypothetical protein
MERTSCILCASKNLTALEEIPQYPLVPIATDQPISEDKYHDFTIIGCIDCGCAQLKTLLDLETVYNTSYSMTTFSMFLTLHDNAFSRFILQNTGSTKFLEVGAVQCQLYKKLSQDKKLDYTVLDLFPYKNLPEGVEFLQANCETFTYVDNITLLLSNVFEHLYNPTLFLKQIQTCKVREVFISIPDFDSQLRSKNVNLINRQHIFYCGTSHILRMFAEHNYRCEAYYNHTSQSCFFKFVFEDSYYSLNYPLTDTVTPHVLSMFSHYKEKINTIDTSKQIFICPAGIYGQKLHVYMKEKADSVVAFIDNDKNKHGLRLYGTDKEVHSPETLLQYDSSDCLILLCESPYCEEIRSGLAQYNIQILDI